MLKQFNILRTKANPQHFPQHGSITTAALGKSRPLFLSQCEPTARSRELPHVSISRFFQLENGCNITT